MEPSLVNPNVMQQYALLGTVLLGFAFTGIVQLLSLNHRRRIVSFTVAVFVVSAAAFIVTDWTCALLLPELLRWQSTPVQEIPYIVIMVTYDLATVAVYSFFTGSCLFIAGVALAGWIRSRFVGMIGTIAIVISFVIVLLTFYWVQFAYMAR